MRYKVVVSEWPTDGDGPQVVVEVFSQVVELASLRPLINAINVQPRVRKEKKKGAQT